MLPESFWNFRLWDFLLRVDDLEAERVRQEGCGHCGGVLHCAGYGRKPRGVPYLLGSKRADSDPVPPGPHSTSARSSKPRSEPAPRSPDDSRRASAASNPRSSPRAGGAISNWPTVEQRKRAQRFATSQPGLDGPSFLVSLGLPVAPESVDQPSPFMKDASSARKPRRRDRPHHPRETLREETAVHGPRDQPSRHHEN